MEKSVPMHVTDKRQNNNALRANSAWPQGIQSLI